VLQAHNALVRVELAAHGGREVKQLGDGFLATFASARRAVRFSMAVQEELAHHRAGQGDAPVEVRVGIHAGDVEREGPDVVGRNVHIACRLCDAAAPSEVLASAVVVDLADSASDVAFGDGRELQLPGLVRPVRAHPVTW
jgi:class 3 adenylate cyclase